MSFGTLYLVGFLATVIYYYIALNTKAMTQLRRFSVSANLQDGIDFANNPYEQFYHIVFGTFVAWWLLLPLFIFKEDFYIDHLIKGVLRR